MLLASQMPNHQCFHVKFGSTSSLSEIFVIGAEHVGFWSSFLVDSQDYIYNPFIEKPTIAMSPNLQSNVECSLPK